MNDNENLNAIAGLSFIYKVINCGLFLWIITINHTTKGVDLIDAAIELFMAGASR